MESAASHAHRPRTGSLEGRRRPPEYDTRTGRRMSSEQHSTREESARAVLSASTKSRATHPEDPRLRLSPKPSSLGHPDEENAFDEPSRDWNDAMTAICSLLEADTFDKAVSTTGGRAVSPLAVRSRRDRWRARMLLLLQTLSAQVEQMQQHAEDAAREAGERVLQLTRERDLHYRMRKEAESSTAPASVDPGGTEVPRSVPPPLPDLGSILHPPPHSSTMSFSDMSFLRETERRISTRQSLDTDDISAVSLARSDGLSPERAWVQSRLQLLSTHGPPTPAVAAPSLPDPPSIMGMPLFTLNRHDASGVPVAIPLVMGLPHFNPTSARGLAVGTPLTAAMVSTPEASVHPSSESGSSIRGRGQASRRQGSAANHLALNADVLAEDSEDDRVSPTSRSSPSESPPPQRHSHPFFAYYPSIVSLPPSGGSPSTARLIALHPTPISLAQGTLVSDTPALVAPTHPVTTPVPPTSEAEPSATGWTTVPITGLLTPATTDNVGHSDVLGQFLPLLLQAPRPTDSKAHREALRAASEASIQAAAAVAALFADSSGGEQGPSFALAIPTLSSHSVPPHESFPWLVTNPMHVSPGGGGAPTSDDMAAAAVLGPDASVSQSDGRRPSVALGILLPSGFALPSSTAIPILPIASQGDAHASPNTESPGLRRTSSNPSLSVNLEGLTTQTERMKHTTSFSALAQLSPPNGIVPDFPDSKQLLDGRTGPQVAAERVRKSAQQRLDMQAAVMGKDIERMRRRLAMPRRSNGRQHASQQPDKGASGTPTHRRRLAKHTPPVLTPDSEVSTPGLDVPTRSHQEEPVVVGRLAVPTRSHQEEPVVVGRLAVPTRSHQEEPVVGRTVLAVNPPPAKPALGRREPPLGVKISSIALSNALERSKRGFPRAVEMHSESPRSPVDDEEDKTPDLVQEERESAGGSVDDKRRVSAVRLSKSSSHSSSVSDSPPPPPPHD
jgi:hypothetical protein